MLEQPDVVARQLGNEQHREVVVGVLVDLRSLVLVADVLDRQRVKLERVLEQLVVRIVGRLVEAASDLLDLGRCIQAINREQGSHGLLIPVAAAATPRTTYVPAAILPERRWAILLPMNRPATADAAST